MSRDLDVEVARAAGWTSIEQHGPLLRGLIDFPPHGLTWLTVPHYSTDIAAAWELLVELKRRDPAWEYEVLSDGQRVYCVVCTNPDDPYSGKGDTAPEAICRAFLAATQ